MLRVHNGRLGWADDQGKGSRKWGAGEWNPMQGRLTPVQTTVTSPSQVKGLRARQSGPDHKVQMRNRQEI